MTHEALAAQQRGADFLNDGLRPVDDDRHIHEQTDNNGWRA